MVFQAHVLKVLIASPGDTAEERDAVEKSIGGWNAYRAEREQTVLLPWRWEMHAVPVMNSRRRPTAPASTRTLASM